MLVLRPSTIDDAQAIATLSQEAGTGLTTLPKDVAKIEEKIAASVKSFAKAVEQAGPEYYLFVLEETDTGEIFGTAGLVAAVGLEQPFYTYKLGTTVHSSRAIDVHKTIPTLILGSDYTGTTEICTLFLSSKLRGMGAGKLLSKARFLFLKQFPERFADITIAEMRGFSDDQGHSPFWECLGRKFFDLDFDEADTRSGEETNEFIAELMPKYPLYVNLLPEKAQKVIGRVHPDTEPAIKLLENEGFEYKGYVDIFDAGPTLEVKTQQIDTLARSERLTVVISNIESDQPALLLANTALDAFRSTLQPATIDGENICINAATAELLKVNPGDQIWAVAV